MRQSLAMPIALVVGAGMMSGAVFLGLRGRPVIYVTHPPLAVTAAVAPDAPAAPPHESSEQVARIARASFEVLRTELVKQCWVPSARAKTEPARESFEVRLVFSAQGQLLSHSVNDTPDGLRLDVAQCLRRIKPDISVPPDGRPSTVQFAIDLP